MKMSEMELLLRTIYVNGGEIFKVIEGLSTTAELA